MRKRLYRYISILILVMLVFCFKINNVNAASKECSISIKISGKESTNTATLKYNASGYEIKFPKGYALDSRSETGDAHRIISELVENNSNNCPNNLYADCKYVEGNKDTGDLEGYRCTISTTSKSDGKQLQPKNNNQTDTTTTTTTDNGGGNDSTDKNDDESTDKTDANSKIIHIDRPTPLAVETVEENYKIKCEDVAVLHTIYVIIWIMGPVALIVMLTLDYTKAVIASDMEKTKKAKSKAPKRILAALILALAPSIITLIVNITHTESSDTTLMYCIVKGR